VVVGTHTADDLSELLVLAVVKAEGITND